MKNLILSGIKHSGKSTIGRFMAELYGYVFYDLDDLILETDGGPYTHVREIYREKGAEHFKMLESRAAHQFYRNSQEKGETFVLALGGGTMENPGVLGRLKEIALLVFIDMPSQLLFDRIMANGRPPFLSEEDPYGDFLKIYEERRKISLAQADLIVDGRGKESREIAEELGTLIKNLLAEEA